jgi:hypothetical protein
MRHLHFEYICRIRSATFSYCLLSKCNNWIRLLLSNSNACLRHTLHDAWYWANATFPLRIFLQKTIRNIRFLSSDQTQRLHSSSSEQLQRLHPVSFMKTQQSRATSSLNFSRIFEGSATFASCLLSNCNNCILPSSERLQHRHPVFFVKTQKDEQSLATTKTAPLPTACISRSSETNQPAEDDRPSSPTPGRPSSPAQLNPAPCSKQFPPVHCSKFTSVPSGKKDTQRPLFPRRGRWIQLHIPIQEALRSLIAIISW